MTRKLVITFALEPELVERIAAAAPEFEVSVLGQEARRLFRGDAHYPSQLQALTTLEELVAGIREA